MDATTTTDKTGPEATLADPPSDLAQEAWSWMNALGAKTVATAVISAAVAGLFHGRGRGAGLEVAARMFSGTSLGKPLNLLLLERNVADAARAAEREGLAELDRQTAFNALLVRFTDSKYVLHGSYALERQGLISRTANDLDLVLQDRSFLVGDELKHDLLLADVAQRLSGISADGVSFRLYPLVVKKPINPALPSYGGLSMGVEASTSLMSRRNFILDLWVKDQGLLPPKRMAAGDPLPVGLNVVESEEVFANQFERTGRLSRYFKHRQDYRDMHQAFQSGKFDIMKMAVTMSRLESVSRGH